MIRHIVWWTIKDGVEGRSALENAQYLEELGAGLMGKIDALKAIEFSIKFLSTSTQDAQFLLQSTHDDAEGLAAYLSHPEHEKYGIELRKIVSGRHSIDYEV